MKYIQALFILCVALIVGSVAVCALLAAFSATSLVAATGPALAGVILLIPAAILAALAIEEAKGADYA
jgi:hypothetical protein